MMTRMRDDELVDAFEACTLTAAEWTHRAHVRVAYCYLRRYGFDAALARLRERIPALNAVLGIEDSPTSGYNETTTHAMLHLVAAVMTHYEATFPTADSEAFCETHPQLMSKHVLRFFYSPARRMDPRAKREFVEPDLTPLPPRIRADE